MSLNFQPAKEVLPRAEAILERERRRLARLGIQGELLLTGGSSLPGALTGGDVDLHLRVPDRAFEDTIRSLAGPYTVVHPEIWSASLATFELLGRENVGIAVTPIGSEYDLRFRRAWEILASDEDALAAYNEMKLTHSQGDAAAYLDAKAGFFETLAARPADVFRPQHRFRPAQIGLAAVPALVLALLALMALAPPRSGFPALVQIFLPHLTLLSAVLVPVALVAKMRLLAAVLVALTVIAGLRFGPEWISLPVVPGPGGTQLQLMTWNLESGGYTADGAVERLLRHRADIVALQELTPAVAAALAADGVLSARFPYQILVPDPGVAGMGLLSRYPVSPPDPLDGVAGFATVVEVAADTAVTVINAHPYPGRIDLLAGVPVAFDATGRDADLDRVRAAVQPPLGAGDAVLLLGDFNVVPTEPGYSTLTDGLRDAHAEVGTGPGWTWRPSRIEGLRVGLLRLDYVLTSPDVRPLTSHVECGEVGDHCLVLVRVELLE